MKINFTEINELLQKGNLAEISRETGIAYRTLQDWKLGNNKWLQQAEERLTLLQNFINMEENKMNINKIKNMDYIWVFDDLSEFLDEDQNFISHDDFEWWNDLANALAYLEDQGIDTEDLKVNELEDYVDAAKEWGFKTKAPKFENLQVVHYDAQHGKGDGFYTLEFNVGGEMEYIEVDEKDHPEAATDEDYFENKEVVDKIIAEN